MMREELHFWLISKCRAWEEGKRETQELARGGSRDLPHVNPNLDNAETFPIEFELRKEIFGGSTSFR